MNILDDVDAYSKLKNSIDNHYTRVVSDDIVKKADLTRLLDVHKADNKRLHDEHKKKGDDAKAHLDVHKKIIDDQKHVIDSQNKQLDDLKQSFESNKKLTDDRIEKLVKLFLSINK